MAVYFLHKWYSPAHELQHGIVLDSMELSVLLPYLAQSLALDWDEANTHAEILSDI
jgi:hypothetical protein